MLVSTARGFFRRIFNVKQLYAELTEDDGVFSSPGRLDTVVATISSGSTSVTVSTPSSIADFDGAVFAIPVPTEDIGAANIMWISAADDTDITINVDVDPTKDVTFQILVLKIKS